MEEPKHVLMAKRLDGFFKLLQILTLIALGFLVIPMLIVTVGHWVSPEKELSAQFTKVTAGFLTLTLPENRVPSDAAILGSGWLSILTSCVSMGLFFTALIFMRKIFRITINGSAFNSLVGDYIRKLAYLSALAFLLQNLMGALNAYLLPLMFKWREAVPGGVISAIDAHPQLNFFFLFLFFVLWFAAAVFDYASEAQSKSAEVPFKRPTMPGPKRK